MTPANRKWTLNDLFLVGTPVQITGPRGAVVVFMQKLDPFDHDRAVTKARSSRARARATYKDETSDEYLEAVDIIDQWSRDERVKVIIAPERAKLIESATSEINLGEDSEWAKDGYLSGLWDQWSSELEARYMEDPDDPDALRVLDELKRYDAELEKALKPQLEGLTAQYDAMPEDALRAKAIECLVERRINEAWLNEYTASELWLATRQSCGECEKEMAEQLRRRDAGEPPLEKGDFHQAVHDKFYFASREAVARLEPPVRDYLEAVYVQLTVDPVEGKDSPESGASSKSSDSQEPEATAPLSGQAAAPA